MPFLKKNPRKIPNSRVLEAKSLKQGFRPGVYNECGDKYTGEYENDKKSGLGVFMFNNNTMRYEGSFKNDKPDGYGVLLSKKSGEFKYEIQYRGEFKKGKKSGKGYINMPDGSIYLGDWKYGKKHGSGKIWYTKGAFYAGNWVNDVRQGTGIFVEPNGNRYEGTWKNDQKHGFGKHFYFNYGQLQEGLWQNGLCIRSYIYNIPYRTAAKYPTEYPLRELNLVDLMHYSSDCHSKFFKLNKSVSLKSIIEGKEENDIRMKKKNAELAKTVVKSIKFSDKKPEVKRCLTSDPTAHVMRKLQRTNITSNTKK